MTDEIPQAHRDAEKRADFFAKMAERILLNKDAQFGGAFVIVQPSSEDSVEMLILHQSEPGVFWAAIQTLAQQAIAEIDQMQRRQGFGR